MPDAGTGLLIVTVAAPTNAVDASRPSSPSTAGIERQVGILGGGQQQRPVLPAARHLIQPTAAPATTAREPSRSTLLPPTR